MLILRLLAALVVLSCIPEAPGVTFDKCVPARWPGGPLEAARRAVNLDPATAAILKSWYQSASLDLLRDTPFNCLLVTWSTGADAALVREQQKMVAEYAREAQKRGFAILGLVLRGADPAQAFTAAVKAELDGLVLERDYGDSAGFARLVEEWTRKTGQEFAWMALPAGGDAPGIRVLSETGAAVATPSSEPWIDSNMWLVRSLRSRGTGPVWLGFTLDHPSSDDYARAIAESAAVGGRWVVAPDDALLTGLARKSPGALATWQRIADTLGFFGRHTAWREFPAAGPLGIVRDPASRYPDIADEKLNLVARRRIPYKIIERPALCETVLAGLRAVLATDVSKPTEKEASLLKDFAERGGLLVTGPAWGTRVPKDKEYVVEVAGKGQVIVYRDEPADPAAVAKELLHLVGKGNLGIRLFNAPTILPYISASADGRQLLVEAINYAAGPAEAVTVRASGEYRKARLYGLDDSPADLPVERSGQATEVSIQKMSVYAALLLER